MKHSFTQKLKPIKRTLRNAGFVLDDFATHIDKKQLSFRHPYIYTGMAIAAICSSMCQSQAEVD